MNRNSHRVKKAAAGDPKAFQMLVEEHTPWLLVTADPQDWARRRLPRTSCRRLSSPRFCSWPRCAPPSGSAPGCARSPTTRRACGQRRRLTQLNILDQLEPEPPSETGKEEIAGLVRKAMGKLSGPHRDVIVHHYLKGYSYRQTASLLQLPAETVKSRAAESPETPAQGDNDDGGIQHCTDIRTRT